jgi:glycosyltransferase involved in cell wall biosynthesis
LAHYLLRGPEPVVFLHTNAWPLCASVAWLALARHKRVVVMVHSHQIPAALAELPGPARELLRLGLRAAWRVVAVSESIASALVKQGLSAHKVVVAPAYIEPDWSLAAHYPLPASVQEFIARCPKMVLASGPARRDTTGDTYGIDTALEALGPLVEKHPDAGILWLLLDTVGRDDHYARQLRTAAHEHPASAHWLFVEGSAEMFPLLRHAAVLLRPTRTDGDAISVREALAAGVPVVASNAALRPPGVRLFATGDSQHCAATLCDVLDNLGAARASARAEPVVSGVETILTILREAVDGL